MHWEKKVHTSGAPVFLSLSVSFFVLFSSDFFLSSSSYQNQDPKKHGDEDNKAKKQR
jgi:hypothetical protein